MSFLGFGKSSESALGTSNVTTSPVVEQIKTEIQQEIATAYAQALVNALTENCFDKCYGKGDQCINDCTSKFMRAWNSVSRAYVQKINQK